MSLPRVFLVPTDFGEPSNKALAYAVDLAKKLEGQIVVLHTFDLPIVGFPDDDCPAESPLAEFNELPEGPPADAPVAAPVGVSATGAVEAPVVAAEPVPSDAARVDEGQGG